MVVKGCASCRHEYKWSNEHPCVLCIPCIGYDYWEAKEAEEVMPDGS